MVCVAILGVLGIKFNCSPKIMRNFKIIKNFASFLCTKKEIIALNFTSLHDSKMLISRLDQFAVSKDHEIIKRLLEDNLKEYLKRNEYNDIRMNLMKIISKMTQLGINVQLDAKDILMFFNESLDYIECKQFKISIVEINSMILDLQEIYKINDIRKEDNKKQFHRILKKIVAIAKTSLVYSKKQTKEMNDALLQILYCLVRFDYDDKEFYKYLLDKIFAFSFPEALLEIQMTSLIITLARLNKKYVGILKNINDFFLFLEKKVYQRIIEDSLILERLPHILMCYASIELPPIENKEQILQKILENKDKFALNESMIIIHCLSKLEKHLDPNGDLQLEFLKSLFQKFSHLSENLRIFNILTLLKISHFIGKLKRNSSEMDFLKSFEDFLFSLLPLKFKMEHDYKSKLLIIYQVTIIQKKMTPQIFRGSDFESFILNKDSLVKLKNHDFITVGAIFNKFLYPNQIYFDFLKSYMDSLRERKFELEIEKKRVKDFMGNLEGFIKKNSEKHSDLKTFLN